jgi:hypothetical protein
MILQTPDASVNEKGNGKPQKSVECVQTDSRPASPVSVASRDGFSNRHSSPVCLQRRHGGLSAPSHRIFCFLQAFYPARVMNGTISWLWSNLRKHLSTHKESEKEQAYLEADGLRGTLFKVFGRGFTSRFSSSSIFFTGSGCDEGDCIERMLRRRRECGCGERWTWK